MWRKTKIKPIATMQISRSEKWNRTYRQNIIRKRRKELLIKSLITTIIFLFGINSVLELFNQISLIEKDLFQNVIIHQSSAKHTLNSSLEGVQGTLREVTAYNVGDINQTFGNPCISANGENICEAVKHYKRCAANFVDFGTILHIENYGECMVTDRMNSRYKNRVDIAMRLDEYQRAVNFGLQVLEVKIIK